MPAAANIQAIANSLQAYHAQLSTLSEALGALRVASDSLIAAIERDLATVTLEIAADATATAAAGETTEAEAEATAPTHTSFDEAAIAGAGIGEVIVAVEEPDVAAASATTELDGATTDLCALATVLDGAPHIQAELTAQIAATTTEMPTEDAASQAVAEVEAEAETITADIASHSTLALSIVTAETAPIDAPATAFGEITPDAAAAIDTTPAIPVAVPAAVLAIAPIETPPVATAATIATIASPTITAHAAVQTPASAGAGTDDNVIAIDEHRKPERTAHPGRRRAIAIVASLALTACATLGGYELMNSDIGQRLLDLGNCDGDALSANRDCALLAWLML